MEGTDAVGVLEYGFSVPTSSLIVELSAEISRKYQVPPSILYRKDCGICWGEYESARNVLNRQQQLFTSDVQRRQRRHPPTAISSSSDLRQQVANRYSTPLLAIFSNGDLQQQRTQAIVNFSSNDFQQ